MTKAHENKLAKVAALGVLAALDYRRSIDPQCPDGERDAKLKRVAHVLGHLQGVVEADGAIHAMVRPELERLGKLLGFEVLDVDAMITAPGNKETH